MRVKLGDEVQDYAVEVAGRFGEGLEVIPETLDDLREALSDFGVTQAVVPERCCLMNRSAPWVSTRRRSFHSRYSSREMTLAADSALS